MNLANKITIFRVCLIPVFMFYLLWSDHPRSLYVAAAVFTVAALTDILDGYVARWQNNISLTGKLLDPIADKLLISAALISLVELDRIAAWVAVLIIGREFLVSGLRLIAAVESRVISASGWGKAKTLSQSIAIVAIIISPGVYLGQRPIDWYLLAAAIALTVISGIDYYVKAWSEMKTNRDDSIEI